MDKEPKGRLSRLRSVVLSDLLKGEIRGTPVNWTRYCADYTNRKQILERCNQDRYLEIQDGNRCVVTFDGLVLLRSTEAKRAIIDCRLVYDVMRAHYKKDLHTKITTEEITNRVRPARPLGSIVLAISLLRRGSGMSIHCSDQIVTPDSSIHGQHELLEKSFRKRVKELQDLHFRREEVPTSIHPAFLNSSLGHWHSSALWMTATLDRIGNDEVRGEWEKCVDRAGRDLSGTIAAAKNLVESACKQTLDERGISHPNKSKLPELYAIVRKELSLDPNGEANESLRKMLGACATLVNGLAELRNFYGDGHGKGPGSAKPAERHARLAITLAGALAEFLLATNDSRKQP